VHEFLTLYVYVNPCYVIIFCTEIAKASGVTGGKWLVHSPRDTIDEKWAKLCTDIKNKACK